MLSTYTKARLHLLFGLALLCVPAQADDYRDLKQVKTVYILGMVNGLDQFLANRLTNSGAIWVVLDPVNADAILTDRLDGVDIVRLLLQKGADPDARLKTRPLKRHHDAGSTMNFGEGTTPLMRASRTGDTAVMKALLDGGANPFLTLPDGTNALLLAAGQGYGGVRGDGIRIVVPTAESAAESVRLR